MTCWKAASRVDLSESSAGASAADVSAGFDSLPGDDSSEDLRNLA
jgi:hypothetical protein